ncbi:MAG: ABC transporter permease [Gemmatimonadetes bacterium]|nr:ABC transporter permease [Gemmatimonadota bacterium]
MDWLRRDFVFALRLLRTRWGVSGVAILVLALGISLTATMYAIIKGVVFTGPDYPNVERILSVRTTIPQSQFDQAVRLHDYLDWREQQTVFDGMAAYYTSSANLSLPGEPAQRYSGVHLSASTFAMLEQQAMMGRTFLPEEDFVTGEPIILLGHHVWENRYDRDPQILGKTIRVNARLTTVVGVMPPDFRFPELHDVWMPLELDPGTLERRQGPRLVVLGRLKEGATQTVAQTQLVTIAQRLEEQYPVANKEIHPITEVWMDELFIDDETRGLLYTMFTAVFGVLLIACANVANLQFALTVARGKELAIRTALGASRNRVLRQLLSETLVLAFGGAVVGLVLAKFSLDLFARVVAPLGIPPWMTFGLSPAVFVFVLGLTFFTALASGLLPAFHATRVDVHSVLKDQIRGSTGSVSRWSTSLVVLEVALSCALLVGAGLTIRSTLELGSADYGLNQENIMTARLGLPSETYPDSTSLRVVTDRFRRELEAMPGVREVAITSNLPILGTGLFFYGVRDGDYVDDSEYPFGGSTRVSPSFFDLIGVPIVAGRGFRDTDALGTGRVVIVDERFVAKNWPGDEPVGKQLRLGRSTSENPWLTVVGVVRDFQMSPTFDFAAEPPEGMFVPLAQQPIGGFSIMLRTAGDPLDVTPRVRDLVTRIDPDIPMSQVNTLTGRVEESNLDDLILTGMFATFGAVALVLASIGLYAVMAFSVTRRTAEVGIRMALGAHGGRIIGLFLRQGARPLGIGIAVGLVLAWFLGRALATVLFRVGAFDLLTFTLIPVLLIGVSLVALLVPARRAASVAPVIALRAE